MYQTSVGVSLTRLRSSSPSLQIWSSRALDGPTDGSTDRPTDPDRPTDRPTDGQLSRYTPPCRPAGRGSCWRTAGPCPTWSRRRAARSRRFGGPSAADARRSPCWCKWCGCLLLPAAMMRGRVLSVLSRLWWLPLARSGPARCYGLRLWPRKVATLRPERRGAAANPGSGRRLSASLGLGGSHRGVSVSRPHSIRDGAINGLIIGLF